MRGLAGRGSRGVLAFPYERANIRAAQALSCQCRPGPPQLRGDSSFSSTAGKPQWILVGPRAASRSGLCLYVS
jgi:hypothetical protein